MNSSQPSTKKDIWKLNRRNQQLYAQNSRVADQQVKPFLIRFCLSYLLFQKGEMKSPFQIMANIKCEFGERERERDGDVCDSRPNSTTIWKASPNQSIGL